MDAVEYLIEKRRATGNCNGACSQCIISSYKNGIGCSCNDLELRYPEKAVEIVEKWAAEHPKKTRQSEFLKMFPNARIRGDVKVEFVVVDELTETERGIGGFGSTGR